jgi:hypothetical protein
MGYVSLLFFEILYFFNWGSMTLMSVYGFINGWCKVDSFSLNKEGLLSEIKKNDLDVVLMDLDLYAEIDGIKTAVRIRSQFGVPVMYKI